MPKRDNYLAHYYEKATIDQLADEYKQKGYNVQREARVDKYRVDLLAEKDGQKVYVEVVRKRVAGEVRRRIEALEELIRKQPNSRLIVVKERYSDEKQIEFNNLNKILYNFFISDFPDELDELSTNTRLESVDSIAIDSIKVYGQDIIVKCSGQVSVGLQYCSDSEQEGRPLPVMSFPFEFEGTISWISDEYCVTEVDGLKINTDEFYR